MSKSPSLRRIQADIRELSMDPSTRYCAAPLENDMFEWHFTIQGAEGTDFEGGVYHGRILLPAEYPFKPPNIVFCTPNGRFETGKKVCLSFSAYHPELWQPAWGIRLILEALISFLPTPGDGAIGALDWSSKERKRLAKDSVKYNCSMCGNCHAVLENWGKKMGHKVKKGKEGGGENRFQKEIEQLHALQMTNEEVKKQEEEEEEDHEMKEKEDIKMDICQECPTVEETERVKEDETHVQDKQEIDEKDAGEIKLSDDKNKEQEVSKETKDEVTADVGVVPTNDSSSKKNSAELDTSGPLEEKVKSPSEIKDKISDSEAKEERRNGLEPTPQEDTTAETNEDEQKESPGQEEEGALVNNVSLETPWISDPVIHTGIVVLSIIIYLLVRKIQAIIVEMKDLEAQFR